MRHSQGHTCCNRQKVKKGLWSQEEDRKLVNYISIFGQGSWSLVPRRCGLQRCGKSCRLRWVNYLRPDLKRGSFTLQEATTIIELHEQLGNKWAKIAKQLPGRTDNEVKNFWNSNLKKKLIASQEKEMMNIHAYLTPMQPSLNNSFSFYPNMIKQEDNFSANPVFMGSNLETQAYNNHNYANASNSEPTATEKGAQPPLPAEIAGIDASFMAAPPSPMRYLETLISEIESLIPTTTVSGSFDSYSASTPPSTSSGSCFLDDAGFLPF